MVGLRHGAGVIAALGAMVLAGCGGGVSAGGTPSATSSAPASTLSSVPSRSSAVPRPTPSGAGAPGVPAAARHHTKAGAIAFAKYYVKVVNEVGVNPKKGRLEPLSDPGCATCGNFIKTVEYNLEHDTNFSGHQMQVIRVYSAYLHSARPIVWVVQRTGGVDLVDDNGKVKYHYPLEKPAAMGYLLEWRATAGWRVLKVKADANAKA